MSELIGPLPEPDGASQEEVREAVEFAEIEVTWLDIICFPILYWFYGEPDPHAGGGSR